MVYGLKILCDILKDAFGIAHIFLNPYIAQCAFYWLLLFIVIYHILELWRHKPWWDYYFWRGLTLISAWISNINYKSNKRWNEITHPFLNFNGCKVEMWEKINPTLYMDVITYTCWDYS